jgi:hypothetical protein
MEDGRPRGEARGGSAGPKIEGAFYREIVFASPYFVDPAELSTNWYT